MTKVCVKCGEERPIKSFPQQSRDRTKRRNICGQCNNILGDIPPEMKDNLKVGLTKSRDEGLLDFWVIPTKRKKTID